jgi:hypothetical protein
VVICLALIMFFADTPKEALLYTRISFLFTGAWWFGFSQYTFKHLPQFGEDDQDDDSEQDGEDQDDDTSEEDAAAVVEADLDDDDLDMGIDDGDDDQDDESAVQASVKARLERASRNRARRA